MTTVREMRCSVSIAFFDGIAIRRVIHATPCDCEPLDLDHLRRKVRDADHYECRFPDRRGCTLAEDMLALADEIERLRAGLSALRAMADDTNDQDDLAE